MSIEQQQPDQVKEQQPPKPSTMERQVRTFPPIRNFIVATAFLAIGLGVWLSHARGDHAEENLILILCTFIAVMTPVFWYTFICGWQSPARFIPLLTLVFLVGMPFTLGRFREVGGEMLPLKWTWWWEKTPDQRLDPLAEIVEPTEPIDLQTTTENDFPQFLGPQRSNYVSGIEPKRDWSANPPELVWRRRIGAGWSAFSAVGPYAVTMEQRGEMEYVTCYEVETGELVWAHGDRTRYDTVLGGVGPRATPTVDQGRVYAMGATGILRCIDGASGRLMWRSDVPKEFGINPTVEATLIGYGRSNSPLVVDDVVVVPAGGADASTAVALVAYDKESGVEIWRGGQAQISYSSPVLADFDGAPQIVSVNESSVSGHETATGKTLWEFPWPGSSSTESNNSQPIPLSDNRLLVTKGYGLGGAVMKIHENAQGKWQVEPLWHNKKVLKTKFTNAVVHEGHAYALSDGILECVELKTGQRMWKRGRYFHGQVLGVGGVLLVMHERKGDVVMVELNPQEHVEFGKFRAFETDKAWNHLALSGPYLLVRDGETAACWKLPLDE